MRFVFRWLVYTAVMPLFVALLLTAIAAPFAQTADHGWIVPFSIAMLRAIATASGMWPLMAVLGLVATVIHRLQRRRHRTPSSGAFPPSL